MTFNRRQALFALMAAAVRGAVRGAVIDTHVHLFDPQRVPYASGAPYRPAAQPMEAYAKFALEAGLAHAVIVHPEPYQDDHRYLEYCFANERQAGLPAGFFKGTCLFDPIAAETPGRMEALVNKHPGRIVALRIHEVRKPGTPPLNSGPIKDRDLSSPAMIQTWRKAEALVKKHPGRIVALRIHEVRKPGTPPLTSGPIKDRDLRSPAMIQTWRKAGALGLGIQMHFLPYYAPGIADLAGMFPEVPVILDHLARAGQGTPEEFAAVLRLARFPKVYMKYSGVEYSSKLPFPHEDVKPLVRRAFDAFGAERMLWGTLGYRRDEYEKQTRLFDSMFAFATEAQRARIRGATAAGLFGW